MLENRDFVNLAAEGRLQRITGFFGSFPSIREAGPNIWFSTAGNPAIEHLKGRSCYVLVSFLALIPEVRRTGILRSPDLA
jgi:hypothetical protein